MPDSSQYEVVLVGTRQIDNVRCLITNTIAFLPITHTLECIDSLIFTSRYAIQSLIESATPHSPHYNHNLAKWREIPCFVIGEKSAGLLYKHGARVAFVGKSSHGETFARELIPLLQGHYPLYLRAQQIISRLDSIIKAAHIPLQEAIAYTNKPLTLNPALKPKPHSVLIFTAPSVYRSFCQNFGWEEGYRAIAIGRSTLAAFDRGIDSYLSDEPSIESCLTLARKLAH